MRNPVIAAAFAFSTALIRVAAAGETQTAGPAIRCDAPIFDFGTNASSATVTHEFALQNAGDTPLIIEKINTGCGCTTSSLSSTNIPPGGETRLGLQFRLAGRSGSQRRSIYVHNNDPANRLFQLQLVGEVAPAGARQPEPAQPQAGAASAQAALPAPDLKNAPHTATTANGRPAVHFDGANDFIAGNVGAITGNVTLIAVCRFDKLAQSAGDFDYLLNLGDDAPFANVSISRCATGYAPAWDNYSDATPAVTLAYDPRNLPVLVTDAGGTRASAWDLAGRPLSVAHEIPFGPGTATLNYTYTTNTDQCGGYALALGDTSDTLRVAYSYTDAGHLGAVSFVTSAASTNTFSYTWRTNALQLAALVAPNGVTNTYRYATNAAHLASFCVWPKAPAGTDGAPLSPLLKYDYLYDLANNCTNLARPYESRFTQYTYDAGQLVSASVCASGVVRSARWFYDTAGNCLVSSNALSGTTVLATRTYNPLNQIRPTPATGPSLYDADGNMATNAGWRHAWDAENRLTNSVNATTRVVNTFDSQHRRVRKQVYTAGTLVSDAAFIYDGWNLIAETVNRESGTTSTNLYIWGVDREGSYANDSGGVRGLLAIITTAYGLQPTVFYPVMNNHGDVMALMDASGSNIVARYEYDPWGTLLSASGPAADACPFRWQTKYCDNETGLYYFGYRFYDSTTGRWLSRDPLQEEGGVNLYEVCGNNPVNNIDPLGLTIWIGGKQAKLDGNGIAWLGGSILDRSSEFWKSHEGDPVAKEILDVMIASTADYRYESLAEIVDEIAFRKLVIAAMGELNAHHTPYVGDADEPISADPKYWAHDLQGKSRSKALALQPDVNDAIGIQKAMEALFSGSARLECGTAALACEVRAAMQYLGNKKVSPIASGLDPRYKFIITPTPERDWPRRPSSLVAGGPKETLGDWLSRTDPLINTDIIPGDLVYFPNVNEYATATKEEGFWRGLNAVYAGAGYYDSLWLGRLKASTIRKKLADAYNAVARPKITEANLPSPNPAAVMRSVPPQW